MSAKSTLYITREDAERLIFKFLASAYPSELEDMLDVIGERHLYNFRVWPESSPEVQDLFDR